MICMCGIAQVRDIAVCDPHFRPIPFDTFQVHNKLGS